MAGPGRIILTLPSKFIDHDPITNPQFNNYEQKALYKMFCCGEKKISGVTYHERKEEGETKYLFHSQFMTFGEKYWSEFDDLTSTIHGKGIGKLIENELGGFEQDIQDLIQRVKNPIGMIEVREIEFFLVNNGQDISDKKLNTSDEVIKNEAKKMPSLSQKLNDVSKLQYQSKFGNYTYSDGTKYSGEWKDNKHHGKGTCNFSNGDRYEGEWKDHKKHGQGSYIYSNGGRYDGEWRDGNYHGKGTCIYSNGSRYDGEWKDHRQHGKGTCSYSNGGRYDGEWRDGKHHGKGTFSFSNGDRYDGEWRDGKHHGKGAYFFSNGDRYEGEWKDHKQHGKGTYFYSNGDRYDGEWENGTSK